MPTCDNYNLIQELESDNYEDGLLEALKTTTCRCCENLLKCLKNMFQEEIE